MMQQIASGEVLGRPAWRQNDRSRRVRRDVPSPKTVGWAVQAPINYRQKPYLTRLYPGEEIILPATDGTKTLAQSDDVFTGYLDPYFKRRGVNQRSEATVAMPVKVYEVKRDGTFKQLFGSLGVPFDQLCLTQHQIREFAEIHPGKLQLDYGTFFPFKGEIDGQWEHLIASVYVRGGHLEVDFRRPNLGWSAGPETQLVVPQWIL